MENTDLCLEIIDFYRPDNAKKGLFISNLHKLSRKESEHGDDYIEPDGFLQIQEELSKHFSKFGPIYCINIVDSVGHGGAMADSDSVYGFVRYYSERDAAKAKQQLTGRLFINGAVPKIKFSISKQSEDPPVLYLAKCYELANHFLGFNGWTIRILAMTDESNFESNSENSVCYRCVVQIKLLKDDLHAEGVGISKHSYSCNAPASKGVAICKAKKIARQEATRNAFSKVILVRLPDDRIYAEVNTTVEEVQHFDEDLETSSLLKVTELQEDPDENSDEDHDSTTDVDDLNKLILQELADATF